jgi:hypothetical protein
MKYVRISFNPQHFDVEKYEVISYKNGVCTFKNRDGNVEHIERVIKNCPTVSMTDYVAYVKILCDEEDLHDKLNTLADCIENVCEMLGYKIGDVIANFRSHIAKGAYDDLFTREPKSEPKPEPKSEPINIPLNQEDIKFLKELVAKSGVDTNQLARKDDKFYLSGKLISAMEAANFLFEADKHHEYCASLLSKLDSLSLLL